MTSSILSDFVDVFNVVNGPYASCRNNSKV